VFCHSRLAREAEAARDYPQFETHVRAVAALAPSHPGVVYQVARAFAVRGVTDSAVAWLARLGSMGGTRDPNADSVFRPPRDAPREHRRHTRTKRRRGIPTAPVAARVRRRAQSTPRESPPDARRHARLRARRSGLRT